VTNLNGAKIQRWCKKFKTKHYNSAPYQLQMNGMVEAVNKNIKKILAKMVTIYKDWHKMLPYAHHGYHTIVRTSTEATPYTLVYGMEPVTTIEVEIPSLRVLVEADIGEIKWVKTRFKQLNMIEGKRLTPMCHGQLYQERMTRAFNNKLRVR